MTKHLVGFLGLLLILGQLTGLDVSTSSIEDYYTDNQIPIQVVEKFYGQYSLDVPIILNINTGKYTTAITDLFKQRLFEDNYRLYENPTDEYLMISISHYVITQIVEHKKIFSRTIKKETINRFNYQVTKYPEGQIKDYRTLSLKSLPEQYSGGMKWYDPVLITAIVGGLVYLLYFVD